MTGDWLCGDIKSATAPIVMEVSVPSFAPPRVLSRLASEVDSAAPGAVGPVALWVVEQVVHLVDGRDAAELPVVRLPSAPEVALLAAVLPAVGRPVAREPCRPAAVLPAGRGSFPLAAVLPAVGRPVAREPYRLAAAVLKVAGRCELVESYPPAHSPLAHWAACSLGRSTAARSLAAWSCQLQAG